MGLRFPQKTLYWLWGRVRGKEPPGSCSPYSAGRSPEQVQNRRMPPTSGGSPFLGGPEILVLPYARIDLAPAVVVSAS